MKAVVSAGAEQLAYELLSRGFERLSAVQGGAAAFAKQYAIGSIEYRLVLRFETMPLVNGPRFVGYALEARMTLPPDASDLPGDIQRDVDGLRDILTQWSVTSSLPSAT